MAQAPAQKMSPDASGQRFIRNLYLYLVAIIGLVVFIFGAVGIINNVLQNYVFHVDDSIYYQPISVPGGKTGCAQSYLDPTDPQGKKWLTPTAEEVAVCERQQKEQAEQNRRNNIGRELSISIAQIIIGLPLWLFHWGIIQSEYRRKKNELNKK